MAFTHSSLAEQLPLLPLVVPLFLLPLLCLFISWRGRKATDQSGAEARARRRAPPGPPKQLPVLGNLLQVGSRPHRYFQAVAQRYGPVVQVQLGRVRAVVVSSPEAAKEVLRTNDVHCCSRPDSPGPRMLSYGFLDVAFSPYSDYWREMRKLFTTELLSARRVQSFAYARAAGVDRLIDSIAAAASSPSAGGRVPVELSGMLYDLNDGIIGTVAFGRMYGSAQLRRRGRSFQRAMEEMVRILGSFSFEDFFPASRMARWADVLAGAAARRRSIFREVDGFLDSVIEKHLDPERLCAGVQEDMVDALVKMMVQGDGASGLTRDHIKGILMDTFAGGIDTCAVTMIWIMSELMRNPRVMRKAQAEVRGLVRNKPNVDEDDVKNLRYLKLVIKENFRLHPPGTLLIPRETMTSCIIGGYSVPPGTRIFVNAWAIGRDPGIWDDPKEFCPERFEDGHVDFRGSNFELLPFGSGRRACPAVAMGVANVELALANLLYCFDWDLPEGMSVEDMDMEETGQLVFRKKVPLCLVPTNVDHVGGH